MLTAYVLAKDEESNIGRCVAALVRCSIPTVVLDSGSTDETRAIASSNGADVENYAYTSHADAYRHICVDRVQPGAGVIVLDADMVLSSELVDEATDLLEAGSDVVAAPVDMCWSGRRLRHASLCPPKAMLFRGGRHYFEPSGHGERLLDDVALGITRRAIVHDDRKPFASYLASQLRYADNFVQRAARGQLTMRDRIRMYTPVLLIASPLASYLFRGGVLDGWPGLGYAIDRAIAEGIMFRQSLATRLTQPRRRGDP